MQATSVSRSPTLGRLDLDGHPLGGRVEGRGVYEGIILANNQFGIVFVIPDEPWLTEEYRADWNTTSTPDCAQLVHLMCTATGGNR